MIMHKLVDLVEEKILWTMKGLEILSLERIVTSSYDLSGFLMTCNISSLIYCIISALDNSKILFSQKNKAEKSVKSLHVENYEFHFFRFYTSTQKFRQTT